MALARAAGADPKGRGKISLLAAAPGLQRLTSADLGRPPAKLALQLTQAMAARGVLSLIFVALAYYFLHTGRSRNDHRRLLWAAVCGVATLLVFCV